MAQDRDDRYLATLRTHWKAHRSFPSPAELADMLGRSSKGTVFEPGDVIVAAADGQLTVKHLRKSRDGAYYFEAANPAYEPVRARSSLDIVGLVTGSFRTMKKRR